jgi:hypothetical protein
LTNPATTASVVCAVTSVPEKISASVAGVCALSSGQTSYKRNILV